MKNTLFAILGIFLVIVAILSYILYNYQKNIMIVNQINQEFEQYTTQDKIIGSLLMTIINKATDYNEKNGVKKDNNNRYIQNEENSIKIEVKFLESKSIYDMEAISGLGSEAFIKNYNSMYFKCTKKEYHSSTEQIKYMLFEQI